MSFPTRPPFVGTMGVALIDGYLAPSAVFVGLGDVSPKPPEVRWCGSDRRPSVRGRLGGRCRGLVGLIFDLVRGFCGVSTMGS